MAELVLSATSIFFLGWTWARESASFWRQGELGWMHRATLEYYHPTLVILGVAIVARIATQVRLRRWRRLLLAQIPLLIFLASLALMAANNFDNWLNDRPLHWHEGDWVEVRADDRSF